jgi:carboxymethylenebutenolidase
MPITTECTSYPSDGQRITLYLARPAAPVKATVLMFGAIWSVTKHIESICDQLASEGFAAAAPCLFRGAGIPALDAPPEVLAQTFLDFDDRRCTRDLQALAALAAGGGLGFDAGALVTWGFCLGGRFAHNLAAVTTQVAGVINFYGRVRFARQPNKPFLPIELAPLIRAPYLGHFAQTDALIPLADVEDLRSALAEQRCEHRIHVYPGARHAFFDSTRPADHDSAASALAWRRSLEFIDEVSQRRREAPRIGVA